MKKLRRPIRDKIKQNQNVFLNYMQRLKPQILLRKWQKLTKTQRQLTINTLLCCKPQIHKKTWFIKK